MSIFKDVLIELQCPSFKRFGVIFYCVYQRNRNLEAKPLGIDSETRLQRTSLWWPVTRRLGRIHSFVLEEKLTDSRPACQGVVPIWLWWWIRDPTARIHGLKVEIHEEHRSEELDL